MNFIGMEFLYGPTSQEILILNINFLKKITDSAYLHERSFDEITGTSILQWIYY